MIDELPERGGGRASLCTGWRVRDVFAHMTATAKMTPIGFVGKFAAAGFRFTVLTANGGTAGDIPAETLAGFRGLSPIHPPARAVEAMLGEVIIHGAGIRRPLGIAHDYPVAAVGRGRRLLQGHGPAGLREGPDVRVLPAPNRHRSADRFGPRVTGPLPSLVLAMTGRRTAPDDLTGVGLSILSLSVSPLSIRPARRPPTSRRGTAGWRRDEDPWRPSSPSNTP